jgi:NNP family nitrate/nitrite transporter-like MFS transporter
MRVRDFTRIGHWPTLLSAFLYFDLSFMLWMLLGALSIFIAQEFGLSPAQKGLLVAVPVLAGAVLRVVLGAASDRWGAKRVGVAGMMITAAPLILGGFGMHSLSSGLVVGALLGVAGASFAVALPLASAWYPPEHQGLAMGVAGAGNSGTVLAALLAPRLAEVIGWRGVFQVALLPLAAVLIAFAAFARDSPTQTRARPRYRAVLGERDLWRLNFFYAVTFGGFVGLASFLPMFFFDQYGCSRVTAGGWAALCVAAGSFLRPVGGYLADRFGGTAVLRVLYAVVAAVVAALALLPALPLALLLLVTTMACLGIGNGAVFQLVGQRFRHGVGVATGIIGAAGGVGGFLLPSALGVLKQATGSYGTGFGVYAAVAGLATIVLIGVQREWRRGWASVGVEAAQ